MFLSFSQRKHVVWSQVESFRERNKHHLASQGQNGSYTATFDWPSRELRFPHLTKHQLHCTNSRLNCTLDPGRSLDQVDSRVKHVIATPPGNIPVATTRVRLPACFLVCGCIATVLAPGTAVLNADEPTKEVGLWDQIEHVVTNPKPYDDPYGDVTLDVRYTRPDGSVIEFWGFYDGASRWRFRCLSDQLGEWQYTAKFSDGQSGAAGTFRCVESDLPGRIGAYPPNPIWFGCGTGEPILLRSLHCGDRFFARNWDDPFDLQDGEKRKVFLDWAQSQGYNTLSIASHYMNRQAQGRGIGWDTPRLWPLNAKEYRSMEAVLDELARRRIVVFPFAGFFGRDANFPTAPAQQTQYLRYTIARLGAYWNLLFNVAGPEPRLRSKPYMSFENICRLGSEIHELDVFGHLITVHNATGNDIYRAEPWIGFGTLQGPKTLDRNRLARDLLRNHHPARPLFAQETLWPGNTFGHPAYSDDDIRRNAYVILFSGAMINFGDMHGSSSSGFSNSMNPAEAQPRRHAIIQRVWETFDTLPWARLKPRPDLVNAGYCLAAPGNEYVVYLDQPVAVDVKIEGGPLEITWINARNTSDRSTKGLTDDGRYLTPPGNNDWILHLRKPAGSSPPNGQ